VENLLGNFTSVLIFSWIELFTFIDLHLKGCTEAKIRRLKSSGSNPGWGINPPVSQKAAERGRNCFINCCQVRLKEKA